MNQRRQHHGLMEEAVSRQGLGSPMESNHTYGWIFSLCGEGAALELDFSTGVCTARAETTTACLACTQHV